jgi:hypothetical protein
MAAVALFLSRGERVLSRLAFVTAAALAVAAAGSMAWTARLGGEIHHPEIRETLPR